MLLGDLHWKPPFFFLSSCRQGFFKVEIWRFFARHWITKPCTKVPPRHRPLALGMPLHWGFYKLQNGDQTQVRHYPRLLISVMPKPWGLTLPYLPHWVSDKVSIVSQFLSSFW